MTRIMGIDPGSRMTGYGVIEIQDRRTVYIASGCVRMQDADFPERLRVIFEGVGEVVERYRPTEIAIEKVFVQRNVDSALKLGQARGAAICAVVSRSLPVAEYSPTQIKQALVGRGAAAKEQVQHMVKTLLQLIDYPQADAADALACALCHSHTQQTLGRLPAAVHGMRGGRGR
ncbi:MAG: crossover junction endodeoxyribonuclease RuvC [Gammaproteobacteria bacterium]